MAKYEVQCPDCGDRYDVQLYGPGKSREWKLDNWDWTCEECRQKSRDEQNTKAAAANAESGLPSMMGSEKQIAWAETIRKHKLDVLEDLLSGSPGEKINEPRFQAAIDILWGQTSATWWIDNRDIRVEYLLREIYAKTETPPSREEETAAKAAEIEAKAEATIRPPNPVTETVAEIHMTSNAVEVIFPEKREDFWQIIKKQLHFEWDRGRSRWRRDIGVKAGTARDRAAEVGNRLLAAGFAIRIFDPDVRAMAIAGNYEPECHRWITKSKDSGRFIVSWSREEDFYPAAKKLPGSHYDKPNVTIPMEQFEQVLDFAESFGFKLSQGAMEIITEARRIRDSILTARPETPDHTPPPVPGRKPRKLTVPDRVEIDVEFREGVNA